MAATITIPVPSWRGRGGPSDLRPSHRQHTPLARPPSFTRTASRFLFITRRAEPRRPRLPGSSRRVQPKAILGCLTHTTPRWRDSREIRPLPRGESETKRRRSKGSAAAVGGAWGDRHKGRVSRIAANTTHSPSRLARIFTLVASPRPCLVEGGKRMELGRNDKEISRRLADHFKSALPKNTFALATKSVRGASSRQGLLSGIKQGS